MTNADLIGINNGSCRLSKARFNSGAQIGEPFFVRGHYVVRTFDRFGRIAFVEINPYTGRLIGYVRL